MPFFSISGSDFVEMFVGVGSSRVRDLFERAKAQAPAILFVDEIDAVGRHRGAGVGGGHDEREQTLNQLLVEMDGFEPTDRVIVIAATNRPDILDPALLRPGRFDRQVAVEAPDRRGRQAILEVHTRGKPLAKAIALDTLAGQTAGLTGADLANLVNEAALLAARTGRKEITQVELEEGIMRVVAGPERRSRVLSERERRVTAVHEMGHAIVGNYLEHSDPVHKISIISRGQALGYTISLPTEDKFLTTRAELTDAIAGGGGDVWRDHQGEESRRSGRQADGRGGPARVRPRPRHAVPGPRFLGRAGLLRTRSTMRSAASSRARTSRPRTSCSSTVSNSRPSPSCS